MRNTNGAVLSHGPKCPFCGEPAETFVTENMLDDGEIWLCMGCYGVSIVTMGGQALRSPTAAELIDIEHNTGFIDVLRKLKRTDLRDA